MERDAPQGTRQRLNGTKHKLAIAARAREAGGGAGDTSSRVERAGWRICESGDVFPSGWLPPPSSRDACFRWAGRKLSAYAGSGLGEAGGAECLRPPSPAQTRRLSGEAGTVVSLKSTEQRGGAGRGRGGAGEDGGEAADPDGEREAQQEHHPAGQRRQDLEKRPRGEGIRGALVVGAVHLCGLWLSYLPNYSEYQDGHVKELTLNKLFSSSCELQ